MEKRGSKIHMYINGVRLRGLEVRKRGPRRADAQLRRPVRRSTAADFQGFTGVKQPTTTNVYVCARFQSFAVRERPRLFRPRVGSSRGKSSTGKIARSKFRALRVAARSRGAHVDRSRVGIFGKHTHGAAGHTRVCIPKSSALAVSREPSVNVGRARIGEIVRTAAREGER